MRWWLVGIAGWTGCEAEPEPPPDLECLNAELEAWCFHDALADGPVSVPEGEVCEEVVFRPGPKASQCGEWDVMRDGDDLNGRNHYFDRETGELVAVAYWTEVEMYCGGHVYWYGEELKCY